MLRDILSKLLKGKDKTHRKTLLITGVRQCEKTYLIKEFEDIAYFNFDENMGLKSVFDYDPDVERITNELANLIDEKKITSDRTLVVFNEIQDCPRAIQSLIVFIHSPYAIFI